MSIWTHVAATIRFDAIRSITTLALSDLGKTVNCDSTDADWDACTVPCGSEGSLQTSLWENPEVTHLAAYTAAIWGDLRNYSDVQEIRDYLTHICDGRMIRSGIAKIDVEGRETVVLVWTDNDGWVEFFAGGSING